jgi:hypothetical protein
VPNALYFNTVAVRVPLSVSPARGATPWHKRYHQAIFDMKGITPSLPTDLPFARFPFRKQVKTPASRKSTQAVEFMYNGLHT